MQIYMDHAATTKLSETALNAMLPYMREYYGNPSSLHGAGMQTAHAVYSARSTIANLLGCTPRELYFTASGSESDNQALFSAAAWGKAHGRQHIITSAFEHPAVLRTLEYLETQGFTVTRLPISKDGLILTSQIEQTLQTDTALVSVMTVNNEIGTIQPVSEIGALCRRHGVLFHTDAIQAAGALPISVDEIQADLLSVSAHKFYGPKGIGLLYVREGIPPVSVIRGGNQERGNRAGTENVSAIVGMAAAFTEAAAQMHETNIHLTALRKHLIERLKDIPKVHFIGEQATCVPGIVNVCFEGVENEMLLLLLSKDGICVSAGSACASGALETSHVLRSMNLPTHLLKTAVRFSFGRDNTLEEVNIATAYVKKAVLKLRKDLL